MERKKLFQGMILQPLSLYLEEEERRAQVKTKTKYKSRELGLIPCSSESILPSTPVKTCTTKGNTSLQRKVHRSAPPPPSVLYTLQVSPLVLTGEAEGLGPSPVIAAGLSGGGILGALDSQAGWPLSPSSPTT